MGLPKERHPILSFTLLELVIVVVIIGSLIAISIPRFKNTFDNLRFENFYRNLVSRMNFLKERSIVTQLPYKMDFDSINMLFSIKVQQKDEDEFKKVSGILFRNISVPEGVEIKTVSPSLFFYPDGTIEAEEIGICSKDNCVTLTTKKSIGRIVLTENDK